MKSVSSVVVVIAAVVQLACLRHLHQAARVPPAQSSGQSEAREAESHRRIEEWFRRRHPDGGLRQKAVEEKLQMAATSGTSGQWRAIGPQPIQGSVSTYSGRVWGIAVDPRNSSVVYAGTDGGGVWKTTDGGTNWTPLTDQQANLNIRDLTLAPSAPDTIFAATAGGILKSTDGGVHWTDSISDSYVYSIAVHPSNASIVLAATDGDISRSADGGSTWTTPLPWVYTQSQVYNDTPQVVFDPANASIAYAATMQGGLYRSTDSGVTWNPVAGSGLPGGFYSYMNVAIAPSNTSRLYLALKGSDNHLIGFYRSADNGDTWTQVGVPPSDDVAYWGWSMRVHPTNPNLIYAGSLRLSMSTDGGKTWSHNDSLLHVDHHVQAYSADGAILYIGNDGGIWKTGAPAAVNTSWTNLNHTLNTAMFYPGISINPATPSISFGGTQDNGTLEYKGNLAWNEVGGCGDGSFTAIDFSQPQNVYAACVSSASTVVTASNDGGDFFFVAQRGINLQDPSEFFPPLVMDPSNARRLYFGTNRLYQTLDGASSWTAISSDLTNNYGGIVTVAVAPSDPSTVYTAAEFGVFTSRNALSGTSATWTAGDPVWASITQITVDPHNPLTAWAATVYDGVYRTTDGGVTWNSLGTGLPYVPVNDIVLDPDISNTIYVATDIGIYRTVDGGQHWLPLGTGLPNVICHALKLHQPSRTLRVATYGRGMWDLSVPTTGQVALTVSHTGNFTQGQPSAMYNISVLNDSIAGTGTISVADTLPGGLTAAAIAGPGWTCTLGTVSCSRSDSLAAGAAYPPITVTVSVASNAPSEVVNQVLLSGGLGSASATDTTAIQPNFLDVSSTDPFLPAIDLLRESFVTSGCQASPPGYCPNDNITLGQMAVFVVRSVMGNDNFTYTTTPYFTDVPATHQFFKWIQKMQDLGIAVSCAPNQYCPDTPVTRGTMSILIIRGRYGSATPSNYPTTAYFADVPSDHPDFPWIQKMKQLGITSGCSPTTYCPSDPVTRGQMAVFIERGEFNQLLPVSTPIVAWISSASASPGNTVTATIVGQNTSFVNGVTQVSAGVGINVSNVSVASGTTLTVQFAVASKATLGPRSITVTTGSEEATLPNGFQVQW
jgi:photosystem II stability/assembly factor-like uncharacterized protein